MNNITKALSYLLIISLLLTAGGFYYHSLEEKDNPTPQEQNVPTPQVNADETFLNEARTIFAQAQQQWMNDSATDALERSYSKCASAECNNIIGGVESSYEYFISFSPEGKCSKYYVTNGEYQFVFVGDELVLENINVASKISDIDPSQVIVISGNM